MRAQIFRVVFIVRILKMEYDQTVFSAFGKYHISSQIDDLSICGLFAKHQEIHGFLITGGSADVLILKTG